MMKRSISLKVKLVVMSLGLVVIPLALIGGISIWKFHAFGTGSADVTYTNLKEQSVAMLRDGIQVDQITLQGFIDNGHRDILRLASSSNIVGYITAGEGQNTTLNHFVEREVQRILEGILINCQMQHDLVQREISVNLTMAEYLLAQKGKITFTSEQIKWNAVNQLTQQATTVELPLIQIGNLVLRANSSFSEPTPIVDEVRKLVGGTCTIFQRMNERGDMIRVATNVPKKDGRRAIGTYIPALNNDGKENPVISAVLQGKMYRGRALVVDNWYQTVYKPLMSENGKVIGMLYVGVEDQATPELIQRIEKIKIGEQGYPFVMNSKGNVLLHPNHNLIGKNTITDLNLSVFKTILENRKAGTSDQVSYQFEGKSKFLFYSYYPDWDWIVCASGYWKDVTREAAKASKQFLEGEIQAIYNSSFLDTPDGKFPLYNQLRLLDKEGKEIIALRNGKLTQELQSKSDEAWYKESRALKAGEVYNSGVVIAANTGKPEMRISSPVYINGEYKGLAVASMDWNLSRNILKSHVYGKTGYPALLNRDGEIVTHPKYTFSDHVNLGDEKFGQLARLVREHVIKGESGVGDYTFEGVEKMMAYAPFSIGKQTYFVMATIPTEEQLALATQLKQEGQRQIVQVIKVISVTTIILVILGGLVG